MLKHVFLYYDFLKILHEIYGAWMPLRTTLSVLAPSVEPLATDDIIALICTFWHYRRLSDHLHDPVVFALK